jgi:predicted dehydrogenase
MNPVRLAVIGAGLIGRRHVELVAAQSRCALVGICDVDPGRTLIAQELGVPFYANIEELLEREAPEGAIISTPSGDHVSAAQVCARRSVHVLVEKPIADTMEGARRIIRMADDTGIRVLVGHQRRHSPFIEETRSVVKGGTLGRLVAVSMLWTLLKPIDYFDVDWRRRRPGGGPTLINLIHEIDILRFICGEVRQVFAHSSSEARRLEVEDSLAISLSFENGAVGSILASDATPSPWSYEATVHENPLYFPTDENCYHFFGTGGSVAFPRMELWHYADDQKSGWQYPIEKSRRALAGPDPLVLQLEHFCRVIRDDERPIVDGRDGARSLSVVLAVLESIRRQAPVTPAEL